MSSTWPVSFDHFTAGESSTTFSQCNKRKYNAISVTEAQKSDKKMETSTWIDRYAAKSFDELAVHKKKVAEVESWISQSKFMNSGPILLLTGPSGCGKTTTVHLAAKAHSIEVCEWSNPLSTSYHVTRDAGLPYQNLSTQFDQFLFRSGRYPSLQFSDSNINAHEKVTAKRLLLLEDLPDHIIREPLNFRDILRQFTRYQRNSLVIIISDRSIPDLTRRNLLPPDVLSQLKVKVISFNPIATTSMNKVLTRIVSMERQNLPKDQLNQIVATSSGDIRTAINSLQFLLQKGMSLPLQSQSKRLKSLRRQKSMDLIKSDHVPCIGGKDVSLLLFRALGKILYCKREKPSGNKSKLPSASSSLYRDPMIFEPEEILEHCCLSGSSYSLFLHHNCVPFFPEIENLSCVFDNFAIADVISSRKFRNDFSTETSEALDAYEGSIAARGVAFWNTDRATAERCESASGQWRPLHKPSWYEVAKKRVENQSNGRAIFWSYNLPSDELLLTQLPYIWKIMVARNKFSSSRLSASAMELNLDQSQKNFVSTVVSLPKWKSFVSGESSRITDVEMGEQTFEGDESETVRPTASDGDLIDGDKKPDPDEDFLIEEFSD